jgi:ubiquinone biosynthesis protein COQ4
MEPYQLSLAQRAFLAPYFGVKALLDPARGDHVAGFGDVLSSKHNLQRLQKRMMQTEEGQRILTEKPLITEESLNLEHLKTLPEDSLGYQYAAFMATHDFSANERSKVRFMLDPDLAYVMVRYRQVHDFWHVLCDVPISVLGEVGLKWFEWRAMGMMLPSAALSGLIAPLRLGSQERGELQTVYFPWAMQAGGACRELLGYDYQANMHKTVQEVRDELGIIPFPRQKEQ